MITSQQIARLCLPRNLRNWLRSPAKSCRWATDEILYAIGATSIVEIRADWSLKCHPAAYRLAYYNQHDDAEQVAEFDAFISNAQGEMVLFDVGAYFGLFSLAAIHYGGARARAFAIEPSPTATRIIEIQARLNQVNDRLSIIQASANNQAGWHEMVSVGVIAGGYFVAPTENHPARELTKVQSITLDGLAKSQSVMPTHIKIDVEGNEAAVIKGAQHVLSQPRPPLLFLELHNKMIKNQNGNPCETLDLLVSFGYQTLALDRTPLHRETILNQDLVRIIAEK